MFLIHLSLSSIWVTRSFQRFFYKFFGRRHASRFNDKVAQTNPFVICHPIYCREKINMLFASLGSVWKTVTSGAKMLPSGSIFKPSVTVFHHMENTYKYKYMSHIQVYIFWGIQDQIQYWYQFYLLLSNSMDWMWIWDGITALHCILAASWEKKQLFSIWVEVAKWSDSTQHENIFSPNATNKMQ